MTVIIDYRKMKQLQKDLESFSQTSCVFLRILFNSDFMKNFTKFHSFEEFLKLGGFEVQNQMAFRNPSDLFDAHVAQQTQFTDWKDMQAHAVKRYIQRFLEL
ncbi:hypothetical protein [Paenibacillus qinlingensis]|uniref:hypothetical protein n=1 Tax=Paenibacillus qinlingensis TaxID=1837343 RepID=UPI0015657AD3|nr:hypothetical protein [Paenibacillus qinlingensis]NQX57521.1 hypothetical protein [Paenibacillus qinlingensis]